MGILEEVRDERIGSSRGRVVPRGVKRKMSRFPLRPRGHAPTQRLDYAPEVIRPEPEAAEGAC